MDFLRIIKAIEIKRQELSKKQSCLIGISGIDASGKGFITAKLAEKLREKGFNTANINVDGWLNLPQIRFNPQNPAENFYENGLRFAEMFEQLILPLRANRSINLTADFIEETANEYRKHRYFYENIEIILLEGIFLFKKEFAEIFDLKIWIECSFETALQRAISRSQEGLSAEETVKAYETIYFPAQKIHFAIDKPHEIADLIADNSVEFK